MKKDKILYLLILINILNTIILILGKRFYPIKWILLIFNVLIVIFCDAEKILPTIFFLHPNSALYDDIGFLHIFNICVVIGAIRLLVKNNFKVDKKTVLLLALLISWELMAIFRTGLVDTSILSLVSWGSSYLVLIIIEKENLNFEQIYKYFFFGFIMAFLCGIVNPIIRWGISGIPTAYRFTGLLRDPNYYSVDALLLIFSAKTYAKANNKSALLYQSIIFILGAFSVSKMFILMVVLGGILNLIYSLKKVSIIKGIIGSIIMIGIITLSIKSGYLEILLNKYAYRTETTSAFTGRDYLLSYYISKVVSDPVTMLLGNSTLKYSKVLTQGISNEYFQNFVAHNTYLDIILSWGVLGAGIYILLISSILRNAKIYHKKDNIIKNNDFLVGTIVFIITISSLSYLATDFFALAIAYLIILKYSNCSTNEKKEEERECAIGK